MIKRYAFITAAMVVAASFTVTACDPPATCEDDMITTSVVDGRSGGTGGKPRSGNTHRYRKLGKTPHGSTSRKHRHHDDCD
jgi:hypothetical protein